MKIKVKIITMNDMIDDTEILKYDLWIEDALRNVIRRALSTAADFGLSGEHHFYITFRTDDDNVVIPTHLKAQHPEEMTIVLQHQFENLTVVNEHFSVILRFNGKPETMIIPFAAITSFADPSVNFGLQLKMTELDEDELGEIEDLEAYLSDALLEGDGEVDDMPPDQDNLTDISGQLPDKTPTRLVPKKRTPAKITKTKQQDTDQSNKKTKTSKADSKSKKPAGKKSRDEPKKTGEVIALDAFRKK